MSDPRNSVGAKIGFDIQPQFPALAKLIGDIEREFLCNVGPARAYFELRGDVTNPQTDVARFVYQTVVIGAYKPLTEETVAELCDYVWKNVFEPAIKAFGEESDMDQRMLFWRKKPVVGHENGLTQLRMRLIVPGVTLALQREYTKPFIIIGQAA